MAKVESPSVRKTAFTCPYCHAHTTQTWHKLSADEITGENPIPEVYTEASVRKFQGNAEIPEAAKEDLIKWCRIAASGAVLVENQDAKSTYESVHNLNLSQCFSCKKVAVWIHDRLAFPAFELAIEANADLPDDIAKDFNEARSIVQTSPRGAAALLRLSIQKLCRHLGQNGQTIDQDIAELVKAGLPPLIQQSLDIVRVIGNEAVHPGEINLNDDREVANSLFDLVNEIAEAMISRPKQVKLLYARLPEAKRKAIERRDQKS